MEKEEFISRIEGLRNGFINRYREALEDVEKYPPSAREYKQEARTFKMAAFMLEATFKEVLKETPLLTEHEEKMKNK